MKKLSIHKITRIIAILAICYLVVVALMGIFSDRKPKFHLTPLVVPDSTQFTPLSERSARIRYLSDVIQRDQFVHYNSQLAREDERLQSRLSFVAIFAILLVALLKKNNLHIRSHIIIITIVLFIGFYWFDIHTVDFGVRESNVKSLFDTTMQILPQISQSDSIWYRINLKPVEAVYDSMSLHPFNRKLCNSFFPDTSQIAFYFLPLLAILVLYLILECIPERRKKRLSAAA